MATLHLTEQRIRRGTEIGYSPLTNSENVINANDSKLRLKYVLL